MADGGRGRGKSLRPPAAGLRFVPESRRSTPIGRIVESRTDLLKESSESVLNLLTIFEAVLKRRETPYKV
jgi:hypothetical protein